MAQKVLRIPAVTTATGVSRSTIYLWVSKGTFPKPINLGSRAVGWLESDVNKWIEEKINVRREKN